MQRNEKLSLEFLELAERDYILAGEAKRLEFLGHTTYLFSQSGEKFIKALCAVKGVETRNDHHFNKQRIALNKVFSVDEDFARASRALSKYNRIGRYPVREGERPVGIEDVSLVEGSVSYLREFVLQELKREGLEVSQYKFGELSKLEPVYIKDYLTKLSNGRGVSMWKLGQRLVDLLKTDTYYLGEKMITEISGLDDAGFVVSLEDGTVHQISNKHWRVIMFPSVVFKPIAGDSLALNFVKQESLVELQGMKLF